MKQLIQQAQNGDKQSLEEVIIKIQDSVYYLALRMLAHPEDAKDASQDIIIRIITKLSTFEFKSSFQTWVYRVATNYLLNHKKRVNPTFEQFQQELESDLEQPHDNVVQDPSYDLMLNEVRIGCTMAMLLCLSKMLRMAYILGEIIELDHNEASELLDITPATFRKQLSRAKTKVLSFTQQACGLVSQNAKCSCPNKLKGAVKRGRVNKQQLNLAKQSRNNYPEIKVKILETAEDMKALKLQNSIPAFGSPENFVHILSDIMPQ